MNLFQEAKSVLDKSGKVNPLGPYGRQKLTGREVATYFRNNKVKDAKLKKAVEVALDLGGAMTVATKEIKKFYGDKIANSPEVKNALAYANESVEFTLDMISEDEVKVDHENPKDRADQKKFRKIIQLGKQAKIKLLDGGGRGYRAQGNRAQVQKFKQLVSKEFGNSVSMSESLNLSKNRIGDKQKKSVDQVRKDMNKSVDDANQKLRDAMKRKKEREDRMRMQQREALDDKDAKSVKKVVGQLKKAVKAHTGQVKSLEKDLQDQKLNEFDTVRKMWEDALEKKNLKEAKKLKDIVRKHKSALMKAKKSGNLELPRKVEDELSNWASSNGDIRGDDPDEFDQWLDNNLDDLVPTLKIRESVNENYRTLARKGMGAEDKKSIKVGREVDYYEPKRGDKRQGKIIKMTAKGYTVQDDQDRKTYTFVYHDRVKAKKLLESLNEVTDKEITMARKLSKDMEKVKKGYQQIAKTGDKTLKDTKFNPTYEAILKAQQKVLSLIGQLSNLKMINSSNIASISPNLNIMDSYKKMHEDSMQDKLAKLFKMRDKKAIDGVANLLNMTSVKVLQSMQKQNPKGFERMAKKMGELPAMEAKEIIDEKLSREDLKLIDKMYDKKGNLTPIGKKVMEFGKKKKLHASY